MKILGRIKPGERIKSPLLNWLYINVLPGFTVTLIMLVILAGGGELYLRAKLPLNDTVWPNQFDSRFGWNFIPGATVNYTNHIDFWTSTQVNSIGFLDRQPPSPEKTPGVCRIAFIGNSYVEAGQVPIDKKFHVVFEKLAREQIKDGRTFETVAFGYDGTGQFNQLPFYDIFARPLSPDVVILVFVSNDFANNSTVLESVRYGWHPLHPPRLFYERDPKTGTFLPIQIDPSWHDHLLQKAPGEGLEQSLSKVSSELAKRSYLYSFLYAGFFKNLPEVFPWLPGNSPSLIDLYRHRMQEISQISEYSNNIFGGWDPEKIDMDTMFATENLPPVFEEAITLTGHAFDEFQKRADRDKFKLLVFSETHPSTEYGGKQLALNRLKKLLAEREIP